MNNQIKITLTTDKVAKLRKKIPEGNFTDEERVIFILKQGLANLFEAESMGKKYIFFNR